jgi:hypothetical protein
MVRTQKVFKFLLRKIIEVREECVEAFLEDLINF